MRGVCDASEKLHSHMSPTYTPHVETLDAEEADRGGRGTAMDDQTHTIDIGEKIIRRRRHLHR